MSQLAEFDWRILSLNKAGPGKAMFAERGFPVYDLEYNRWMPWKTILPTQSFLREQRPDVLLMTGHSLLATIPLSKSNHRPQTLWMHYLHSGIKSPLAWRAVYLQALAVFDRIVFASEFIRQEAIAIEPRVAARSVVIYSPLQLEQPPSAEARRNARLSLGLPQDAFIAGNAGRLIQPKRFDVFLRVVRELSCWNPSLAACIAGDGPLLADLRRLARELGLEKRVHFLGPIADMASFYQSLDLLVFNSDGDALGMMPLEAMAYGVPTVASCTHSGLREIFDRDLLAQFYRTTHNVDELAALAREALSSAHLVSAQRAVIATEMNPAEQAEKFRKIITGNSLAALRGAYRREMS